MRQHHQHGHDRDRDDLDLLAGGFVHAGRQQEDRGAREREQLEELRDDVAPAERLDVVEPGEPRDALRAAVDPHEDRAGRRERADQHEDLAGVDDEQHAPHDLDHRDREEAARERGFAAVVDHREHVQQARGERADRDEVADLADEDGLVRGRVVVACVPARRSARPRSPRAAVRARACRPIPMSTRSGRVVPCVRHPPAPSDEFVDS